MNDQSAVDNFYEYNVDRFMDSSEVSPPKIPLTPFQVFMTACQYYGVTGNGGWSHGLVHYAEELDIIENMLDSLGATYLLSHVRRCRPLIDYCQDESTSMKDRGAALDKIDAVEAVEYSRLNELVNNYFHNNYDEIRSTM